jgi:hypothetical protein
LCNSLDEKQDRILRRCCRIEEHPELQIWKVAQAEWPTRIDGVAAAFKRDVR